MSIIETEDPTYSYAGGVWYIEETDEQLSWFSWGHSHHLWLKRPLAHEGPCRWFDGEEEMKLMIPEEFLL